MAKHRTNPNFAFGKMLKQGYDHFEATKQEPKVAVCEKRYVFDPAAADNATHPLSFNARGKCPIYQVDKNIADVVLDHQRKEQFQMAQYIAQGVSVVPPRHDVDGGMNPVFADKIVTPPGYDSKGQPILVATAQGARPRDEITRAAIPRNCHLEDVQHVLCTIRRPCRDGPPVGFGQRLWRRHSLILPGDLGLWSPCADPGRCWQ